MVNKIQVLHEPCTHVIIDDFLPVGVAREVLEEAIAYESQYEINKIDYLYPERDFDDCDECVEFGKNVRKRNRMTDVFYVDNFFKGRRLESAILRELHHKLFDDHEMRKLCKGLPTPFNLIPSFNLVQETVSRYGKCEFYGWHVDAEDNRPTERLVTCVYYMNKEPEGFTGGDLFLGGKTTEYQQKYITVKPKHNRAVFFAGDDYHAVDTVTNDQDFSKSRFSINCWLGYQNVKSRLYSEI